LKLFSFSAWKTSLHDLLAFNVSVEKSAVILMGLPLCYLFFLSYSIQHSSSILYAYCFQWKGLPAVYCCRLCSLKVHMESCPSPLLGFSTPLCCVSFSVPYYSVFFLWGGGQSVQGALLVYPRGGCGSTTCHLFAHLLVCVSQAGLELASGSVGALLVSQCNMVWRSFVQAGGSGCWEFCFFWWVFFCQVWLQYLSKIFDLRSSCCLLPPSSCHLSISFFVFLMTEILTEMSWNLNL
jgi:hypothetical protein